MSFTPIAKGTPNWDTPLNSALAQLDNTITGVTSNTLQASNNLSEITNAVAARLNLGLTYGAAKDSNVINVKDHGALGDNTSDDTAAIQSAIGSCPIDGIVYFPVGFYRTTSPIIVPPGITLMGEKQKRPRNSFGGNTNLSDGVYISPRSTFSGSAVILIRDAQSSSTSTMAQGTRIIGLYINGSALTVGSNVDGIQAFGQVQGLILKDVNVTGVSGYCYNFARNSSVSSGPSNPFSLRVIGCYASGGGTATTLGGYFLYQCTDSTFEDCEVIAVGGDGWTIQGGGNSTFLACRSENNSGNGFTLGTTAGGTNATATMVGCSTNGNAGHGFNITSAYTVNLVGCHSGGEGATKAGFNIASSTGVVSLANCMAASSGSTSQYGLQIGSTLNAVINGGLFYGVTAGYNDNGSNTNIYFSPNVLALTGTPATPTVSSPGLRTNSTGVVGDFAVGGRALGIPTPQISNGFVAWTHDPILLGGNATAATSGTVYLCSVEINTPTTISKAFYYIGTAATSPTSGQNFVGVYDSNGNKVGSQDITSSITSTGPVTTTFTTPFTVTPGRYYIAFVFNGTTNPGLQRQSTNNVTAANINKSGATLRVATGPTSQTTLPANITMSSNTGTNAVAFWAAIG